MTRKGRPMSFMMDGCSYEDMSYNVDVERKKEEGRLRSSLRLDFVVVMTSENIDSLSILEELNLNEIRIVEMKRHLLYSHSNVRKSR
jgi:hypothetical protein